jgi:hypothetical protein
MVGGTSERRSHQRGNGGEGRRPVVVVRPEGNGGEGRRPVVVVNSSWFRKVTRARAVNGVASMEWEGSR